MISWRLCRITSGSWPRSPSFAPSSSTRTRTGRWRSQSMRRSPPAEVSPLTPAFTTRKRSPAESSFSWIRAGYAWSTVSPYPAVRLVPRKRITGRSSDAAGGMRLGEREATSPLECDDAPSASAGSARPPAWEPSAGETSDAAERTSSGLSPPPQASARTNHRIAGNLFIMMIVAEGLERTYLSAGRPLTVLRDIDLAIEPESFVAIVRPSGSGKTTLLGLLAGLDLPTAGTVRLGGQDLSALTEDERALFRAEKVGFVFQTFHLIPTLTALENVLVPLELNGGIGDGKAARERARSLLARVGLGDRLHHYPAQLSGGEQQRVALARAFANRPMILFADEPTGNLDAETGARVIDPLVELNEEARTTLVLVTHDPELAPRAHRVIRLAGGRIVSDERRRSPPGSPSLSRSPGGRARRACVAWASTWGRSPWACRRSSRSTRSGRTWRHRSGPRRGRSSARTRSSNMDGPSRPRSARSWTPWRPPACRSPSSSACLPWRSCPRPATPGWSSSGPRTGGTRSMASWRRIRPASGRCARAPGTRSWTRRSLSSSMPGSGTRSRSAPRPSGSRAPCRDSPGSSGSRPRSGRGSSSRWTPWTRPASCAPGASSATRRSCTCRAPGRWSGSKRPTASGSAPSACGSRPRTARRGA